MITGTTNSQQKPLQKQGIITSGKDVILSGTKWLRYQKKFSDIVEHVACLCVSTLNKIKIIKALQAKDQFVAMTGDGVMLRPKALTLGLLWELMGQPFPKRRPTWFYLMIIFYYFDCRKGWSSDI
jgi:Ca2+-transporting ATPase